MSYLSFSFGVLPQKVEASGNGWVLDQHPDYDETLSNWGNIATKEGWVLPPVIQTVQEETQPDGSTRTIEMSNTQRSAELWKLPPTHTLTNHKLSLKYDVVKQGVAYFLIQCIASIYGCELQFSDWSVRNRKRREPLGFFSEEEYCSNYFRTLFGMVSPTIN